MSDLFGNWWKTRSPKFNDNIDVGTSVSTATTGYPLSAEKYNSLI